MKTSHFKDFSLKEKSVGAIIFFQEKGKKPKFLLLHYAAGHWDYCKGHSEENETELDTLKRELLEETGITSFSLIPKFREEITYFFKREKETVKKTVVFYLIQVNSKNVRLSFEHLEFKWLPFESALKQLTFDSAKQVLEKANDFLKQKQLTSF